jgi:hypothetical protein
VEIRLSIKEQEIGIGRVQVAIIGWEIHPDASFIGQDGTGEAVFVERALGSVWVRREPR